MKKSFALFAPLKKVLIIPSCHLEVALHGKDLFAADYADVREFEKKIRVN